MKKKDKNTEGRILEAAKGVFQSKGMDGARMQEIADEAGINKAMLHYYYRSKYLLFKAVFKNAFSLLAPQLNKILNNDASIEDKIVDFTTNYVSFIMKHPYLPNFIIQELNRNPAFLEDLKSNKNFPNIQKFKSQVNTEIKQGILVPISGEQLFINIVSLNIFPFIGAPLLKGFIGINDKEFQTIMEERKVAVSQFIISAIKPIQKT